MAERSPPPVPDTALHISYLRVPAGSVMHRIHHSNYRATQFNPTSAGNARFSPIHDSAGAVIPTLYAGSTFECAAMETVFHDVPFAPGLKTYPKNKLDGYRHSRVEFLAELRLVDLTNKALRLLGVTRAQLIDTEKDQYPICRHWAETIHAHATDIHGLYWVSRQDDTAVAIVLFGDRVPPGAVIQHSDERDLLDDEAAYSEIISLAEKIGVLIVPGP
ncbi:MAG: RES family NAD+ phosphorylase [Pseudomonas sp.]|uniref:RES family NAD+ phosphorylase n=1 Tax=Pseudomonas sp. TaxID=306 RepID=UPI00339B4087